jgi:serine/threonine protein kinase
VVRCPQCNVSYDDDLARCPADGTTLAPQHTVNERPSGAKSPRAPATLDWPTPDGGATPATSDELKPGTRVGEYVVKERIGEGGMGVVFAGEHPVIGKKVAIKVLNLALANDPGVVQRFVQEARSVNQIGHRNIVDIFGFGQLPSGRHYFVMELLPGRSLRSRLNDPAPLPYSEMFSILVEVCDALAAAHAAGIVHRDLKPDNIFLVEPRPGERGVKLLDFGIAKLLQKDAPHQTRSGEAIGTPQYMSPEQCLCRTVDARTDIYALGVIMFEMLTGKRPFSGISSIEIVNGHLKEPPPPPSRFADVPASIDRLVLACLAKNAAARPQSVEDVRREILEIARELGADKENSPTELAPRRRDSVAHGGARRWPLLGAGIIALLAAGAWATREKRPPEVVPVPVEMIELQVVSNPVGASVEIDGKPQALRTPSTYRVARADHLRVRVSKPGFTPREEAVELLRGETQHAVELKLEETAAPFGTLKVRTNVIRASWSLDGAAVGDGRGELAVDRIAPGDHRLRVEARGFQPREEHVTIAAHEQASLEWQLVSAKRQHSTSQHIGSAPPVDDDNATSGWPPK